MSVSPFPEVGEKRSLTLKGRISARGGGKVQEYLLFLYRIHIAVLF